MTSTASIKKLDINSLQLHKIFGFVGRRESGKTTLMMDFMYHFRNKFHWGIVMCGSEDTQGAFGKAIPKEFIYTEWVPDKVSEIFKTQEDTKKAGLPMENVFIIIDDCSFDTSIFKDKVMRRLFMNGRHYNITILISTQYLIDMPPGLRSMVDYVFSCIEINEANIKKLYINFYGCVPTFKMFRNVFSQCTTNFECIFVNTLSRSKDYIDALRWYKAAVHKATFHVGSNTFWLTARKMREAAKQKNKRDNKKRKLVSESDEEENVKRICL